MKLPKKLFYSVFALVSFLILTNYSRAKVNNYFYLQEPTMSNIKIENQQNDNLKNTYIYKITIEDIEGAIKYTVNNNTFYAIFNAKNESKIQLNSNETIIIYDIPFNKKINIEQDSIDNYVTTVNGKSTNKYIGTVSNNLIIFNNTIETVNTNPNTNDSVYKYIFLIFVISLLIIWLKKIYSKS